MNARNDLPEGATQRPNPATPPGQPPSIAQLEAELDWLADALQQRLQQYFDAAGSRSPGLPGEHLPPPVLPPGDACPYAALLRRHALDADERLLLALAIAPLLRPALLDVFWSRNESTGRPFTEFGGAGGAGAAAGPGGFVPSGETACFLLAGDALGRRLAVLQRLAPHARLARDELLHLDPPAAGDPVLSGALRLGERFVAAVLPELGLHLGGDAGLPARRVGTGLSWEDLVLPSATLAQLDDIGLWLTHGRTLLDDWGLGRRVAPGYTALFHGPPGTGKTLSACLLGARCGREVWRIDLSLLVSKYIGETEKNLARLFDTAEARQWILFFDEADALFGKRTGVSDAHDRYANQEVSYLLQRVESFAGVVILASNLRHNIDDAFLRRFQAVLPFTLPRPAERLRLWREGFPATVTLEPTLDLARIAQQHELSGGTILNIVRWCCLRALGRSENRIRAEDVHEGIRRELQKEGRAL